MPRGEGRGNWDSAGVRQLVSTLAPLLPPTEGSVLPAGVCPARSVCLARWADGLPLTLQPCPSPGFGWALPQAWSLLRVMTAPWLAPQRNGGNPLTLGWGTARSQGTSHPAHLGQTSKGPGQPRGKRGAARGPASQMSGRASGVMCSKGTHTRVCAHTQGLPGTAGRPGHL